MPLLHALCALEPPRTLILDSLLPLRSLSLCVLSPRHADMHNMGGATVTI